MGNIYNTYLYKCIYFPVNGRKLTHNDNDKSDENLGFATVEESDIGKATSGKIRSGFC